MKRDYIILAIFFLVMAVILHYIHFLIFQDAHDLFFYLLLDIAFLPLEIFFVVLVVERMLASREHKAVMQKLNMVIGAFFSEVGNQLLVDLLGNYNNSNQICQKFNINQNWSHSDFQNAMKYAGSFTDKPVVSSKELEKLKNMLIQKREFLLRLLENPNLLEHERFTDLLWATFHLVEELEARQSFDNLPSADLSHITLDIQRVYSKLAMEWIYYVEHLKLNYPFLYSLITRIHPFQEHPSPVISDAV